jgi:hypothetical protein
MEIIVQNFNEICKKQEFAEYLMELAKLQKSKKVYIVEPGSGTAELANYMIKNGMISAKCYVAIDPDPLSYSNHCENNENVKIHPKYSYTDECVARNKSLVGNCILLLVRPAPYTDYDYKAFIQLKPIAVFMMYRADGADASESFHQYLHHQSLPSSIDYSGDNQLHNQLHSQKYKYKNYIKHSAIIQDGNNITIPTVVLLSNEPTTLTTGELNQNPPSPNDLQTAYISSLLSAASLFFVFRATYETQLYGAPNRSIWPEGPNHPHTRRA